MDNLNIRIEGDKMIIEIDLTKDYGPTSTGRTTVVASSHGWQNVALGLKANLMVVKK